MKQTNMKQLISQMLLPSRHFLIMAFLHVMVGKMISQSGEAIPTTPNGLPLYEDGKLYFQLKANSSVVVVNENSVTNDVNGSFQALFTKYQVSKTELPFTVLNNSALNKTYRITFSQIARVDSFIIELTQISSDIEYAEKVPAVYTFLVPNDPLAAPTTTYQLGCYHLGLLNANLASNIFTSTGQAPVAIVDDAVLTAHEDLTVHIASTNTDVADGGPVPDPPLSGTNAASNSYFTHGTHVAGIAGAETNNGKGVASIGWGNKLMCVKSRLDNAPLNAGLTNAYDGVAWAAANGASVINMSWGTYTYSQTDYTVVVAAKSNDVVLVGAAGNDETSWPTYPASYGEGTTGQNWEVYDRNLVVAVASLDQNNHVSIWGNEGSNFGSWVDIAAYGTDILSTLANSSNSAAIINNYGLLNGTSMAAPQISGIVGVMRSYDPSKSADEVINCLRGTANPDIYAANSPGYQLGMLGSGRADAAAALRCISTTCSVNPIVVIVPSSPNLCANSTLTLTANQPANTFLWSTGATTHTISVNSPGVYSVTLNYLNCNVSASINISSPPTLTLSSSTSTNICPGTSIYMLSASGNYNTLIWQPSGAKSNSVIVNPSSFTIYSATANSFCGGVTATIGVNPPNTNTLQLPFGNYAVLDATLAGIYVTTPTNSPGSFNVSRYILSTDATVNTSASFNTGLIWCAPNVEITVPTNCALDFNLSVLRSCSADMWKGISLQDGARLSTRNQSVIEDAITAISSVHSSTSNIAPPTIWLKSTVFNKNYMDISLANYSTFNLSQAAYSNSLRIDNCVFTCRDFSGLYNFTPPFWPSAGMPFPIGFYPGIRAAGNPTTGLISPYLAGWPLALLKNPYSSLTSSVAINLSDIGVTTGTLYTYAGVSIGSTVSSTDFNLFDNHYYFVRAKNSNLSIRNAVFQNTKKEIPAITINNTVTAWSYTAGIAIEHSVSSVLNAQLDLESPSVNTGIRFWNCHQAVSGTNTYKFTSKNNIFRSTQSSTLLANGGNVPPGHSAINLNTNRLLYDIRQNEFTNINECINIPISSGQFTSSSIPTATPFGANFGLLAIGGNTFSPGSGATNYLGRAIRITRIGGTSSYTTPQYYNALNTLAIYLNNPIPNTYLPGTLIWYNKIENAQQGILISNINPATAIFHNTVNLAGNNVFSNVSEHFGINQNNCTSANNNAYCYMVRENHVSANSVTNTAATLIYNSFMQALNAPQVTCNQVKNGMRGFVFESMNKPQGVGGTTWGGNYMEDVKRGMSLVFSGVIGDQGNSGLASNNHWVGNTWNSTNSVFCTYVDANSYAINSKLWVDASEQPTVNGGSGTGQNWYDPISTPTINSALYQCVHQNNLVVPLSGNDQLHPDGITQYMYKTGLYKFLYSNDSIRSNNEDLGNFYESSSGTNISKLLEVEIALDSGNYEGARTALEEIELEEGNYVESNYATLYDSWANWIEADEMQQVYPYGDSLALVNLGDNCPGEHGACVFQARALYNTIYNTDFPTPICPDETYLRRPQYLKNKTERAFQNVQIYPNPTNSNLMISCPGYSMLDVSIYDLTGRNIKQLSMIPQNNLVNCNVSSLDAGCYFLTIKSQGHENMRFKFQISR